MLRKMILLALYCMFLFGFCRILEKTPWWYDGDAVKTSKINIKKLKMLLDHRGIDYISVIEKTELVNLVEASGRPKFQDLQDAEKASLEPAKKSTEFLTSTHYYNHVEDVPDNIWLLQIHINSSTPLLFSQDKWNKIKSVIGQFGIKTGVFKCSKDPIFCLVKHWTTPRLVLARPHDDRGKMDMLLHSYTEPSSPEEVVKWMCQRLSFMVTRIQSDVGLDRWMTYQDTPTEIRVALFSDLKISPMFLSALTVRFKGRVRFAMVDVSQDFSHEKYVEASNHPAYMVVTPGLTFKYGDKKNECYNFKSMESFLITLGPEMSEILPFLFFFANVVAAFEGFELLFFMQEKSKRLLIFGNCIMRYNLSCFLVLPVIYACLYLEFVMKFVRIAAESDIAATFRSDYKRFYSFFFLVATFPAFCVIARFTMMTKIGLSLIGKDSVTAEGEQTSRQALEDEPAPSHETDTNRTQQQDTGDSNNTRMRQSYSESEEESTSSENELGAPSTPLEPSISSEPSTPPAPIQHIVILCKSAVILERRMLEVHTVIASPNLSKARIRHLPVWLYLGETPPEDMRETHRCAMCLEDYIYLNSLSGLPCGHNFHMNCLVDWFRVGTFSCAVCRWPSN